MKKVLLFVAVSGLLLVSAFSGFSQVLPELPRNEILIAESLEGRVTNPKRFNVWVYPTNWMHGYIQLSLDALWYIDSVTGEWTNALANERPIYNDDYTKMTAKLRRGIYWSDGVQFTADDVVFTIKTLMDNPGMAYGDYFKLSVEKIYKTDDYTVVFELKKPNSRFHSNLLVRWGACYIMPKHIWEKVEDPKAFDFYPPVSLGPYVIKKVDPTGNWFLWERREDWHRTSLGKTHGKPKPKYVLFTFVGPDEKKVMAQIRHELDLICMLTPEAWLSLKDKNPYSECWYEDFPWAHLKEPYVPGITINNDKYPLNIRDVRWALTLATDIVEAVMIGYSGAVTITAIANTPTAPYYKWYYEPMENWLRNFTLNINGGSFKPYDPSIPSKIVERCEERGYSVPDDPEEVKKIWGFGWWKYAPEIAGKLLEKHGFKRDENGKWLLPDGTPWKITILAQGASQQSVTRMALAIAKQWTKFGIDANCRINELCWTIATNGEYESVMTWPVETWGGYPDLFRHLGDWHSRYYAPIGEPVPGRNATRWKDKRMDQIIEKLEALSPGESEAFELEIEALKLLVEEMPLIPMVCGAKTSPVDQYYWTNFPTAENPYAAPYVHFANFRFVLPFIEPTGRE